MRVLIFLGVGLAVAVALLCFDNVDRGLPVVTAVIWAAVLLAGALLAIRARLRGRHRVARPVRSGPRPGARVRLARPLRRDLPDATRPRDLIAKRPLSGKPRAG